MLQGQLLSGDIAMSTFRFGLTVALIGLLPHSAAAQQRSTKEAPIEIQRGAVELSPNDAGNSLGQPKSVLPTAEELLKDEPKLAVEIVAEEMGMVRLPQHLTKALNTLEFTANGTMAEKGKNGTWGDYRISKLTFGMDFVIPASRMEMQFLGPGIQKHREIRVAAAKQAWNEKNPGIDGTAMPDPSAAERERLIWLTPQGAMWAALLAGDQAVVSNESGQLVIRFPVGNEPAKMLLNAQLHPTRMEIQADSSVYGKTVFAAAYMNYTDFEGYLVPFPRKMIFTAGGRTIFDLNIISQISNPYVIFPLPPNMANETTAAR